ncbi:MULTISPECIES: hypothetical protein [unclassified Bradyrhizobium]|uniref:hypothetical protein n=1 Tax=unclassified Bradyrhizobium TaxID=2631580 RepID=UPI0029162B57|nr:MULTISPECIES: hypothetical protein [unclassified Bradyrhizobium]
MAPDPRWLEILKASGWQTGALAVAAGLVLWANQAGWLPPFEPWMVQAAAVVMIVCGLLAFASFASNAAVRIGKWSESIKNWSSLRHSIRTLNSAETAFLKAQVEKNEATVQLRPFNAGGIPNFVQQAGMYQGLQNKGIVSVTAADPQGKILTITIEPAAWRKLKRKFKTS